MFLGGSAMKTASKERTLQWISNQYNKGNISFSHKLQRPIGQWSPKMKSLLIHSLLSGFPVNPIYCVEELLMDRNVLQLVSVI